MADYLFNYAAGSLEYGSAPLSEQASALLREGIWGLPESAAYCKRIAPGDRMVAYVGGTEKAFVGEAVLATAHHPFSLAEAARHPGQLLFGVTFSEHRVWDLPVPADDVWARLTLARRWVQGAIMALGGDDFELIATGASTRLDGSRPFDPSRRPATYNEVRPPDAEAAAALAEKATQDHFNLVAALDARLRREGWTEVLERPGSIDLWGRDPGGRRHIFEVKTLGNELGATRAALAQLLEYRVLYGAPEDQLCLVTGAPLSQRRARVLAAFEVEVLVLDGSVNRS